MYIAELPLTLQTHTEEPSQQENKSAVPTGSGMAKNWISTKRQQNQVVTPFCRMGLFLYSKKTCKTKPYKAWAIKKPPPPVFLQMPYKWKKYFVFIQV